MIRPEAKKYLFDMRTAADSISEFVAGKTFGDYEADDLLRSGVERQFEILGEALAQLLKEDAAIATQISEYRRIISFRNILAHAYAQIDDRLVWDIIQTKLSTLRREVAGLLAD